MQRIAFGVEYVGTNYSGWQSQQNQPGVVSVQAVLEVALSQIANHPVEVFCAGRTDAGVHACGQVIHFDSPSVRSTHAWIFGCNSKLPPDIRIIWAKYVPPEFDARRSAIGRHYRYVLYNNSIRPSLMSDYIAWHYTHLNTDQMHLAAQSWLGENDFSSFRAAGCQSKSPMRNLQKIEVTRRAELVIIDILADAFLYHMVRNMVGVLLQIGGGKRPVEWAREVLLARDRAKGGKTASPQGLYLFNVRYPQFLEIPEQNAELWFFKQGLTV